MEVTTKYYKQQSTIPELLEVHYHGRCAWLKGAQVMKQGGVPGGTPWSEDPLVHKKKGWCLSVAWFPGIGVGTLAESSESWCRLSATNCELLPGCATTAWCATAFLGLASKWQKNSKTPP